MKPFPAPAIQILKCFLWEIDKLVKAANPNAMHDSSVRYDPPKCHLGTRKIILKHIMQWIFGSDDEDALILWLYGPAGAGKSAILQSIAEKCAELGNSTGHPWVFSE